MRRLDVHVHLLARDDAADLELVPAADEGEIVDQEQIALAFEARERGGAEARAGIGRAREFPRRVSQRRGVASGGQEL